jgi:hypothetical protein
LVPNTGVNSTEMGKGDPRNTLIAFPSLIPIKRTRTSTEGFADSAALPLPECPTVSNKSKSTLNHLFTP